MRGKIPLHGILFRRGLDSDFPVIPAQRCGHRRHRHVALIVAAHVNCPNLWLVGNIDFWLSGVVCRLFVVGRRPFVLGSWLVVVVSWSPVVGQKLVRFCSCLFLFVRPFSFCLVVSRCLSLLVFVRFC